MRQVSEEELAEIIWDCQIDEVDHQIIFGHSKPSWFELEEFNKDDCRALAKKLLAKLRIAI